MHDPAGYGDAFADVYDDWYGDGDATDVVAFCGEGRTLVELGAGTGRLAVPLAAAGWQVHGIDASAAMLDRLARRAAAAKVRVETALGDAADAAPWPVGPVDLVLAADNFVCNLPPPRRRSVLELAARRLVPGGRLVTSTFVPDPAAAGRQIVRRHASPREVTFIDTTITGTRVEGRHVTVRAGGTIVVRPWRLWPVAPEALDRMVLDCGLALVERWSGWRREPFVADESSHAVALYAP